MARGRPDRSATSVLRVEDLAVDNDLDLAAVRSASVTVRAGELVAIVGVDRQRPDRADGRDRRRCDATRAARSSARRPGRARLCLHSRPSISGSRWRPTCRSPTTRFSAISGGRRSAGGCAGICSASGPGRSPADFGVTADPAAPVRRLSGGNLQRLVLGRELHGDPALIVAELSHARPGCRRGGADPRRAGRPRRRRRGGADLERGAGRVAGDRQSHPGDAPRRDRRRARPDPPRTWPSSARLVTTGGA